MMSKHNKNQKIIFNIFQPDIWKTKKTNIFFGSFSSFEKANQTAKDLNLYSFDSEVVILEVVVDEIWDG